MPTRITKLANCQSGGSEAGEETIFIYSPISHLLTPYTPHPTPHAPHPTPHTPLLQQL
ncbi:MAG: hypothetical protein PX639_23190 [Microcystis sp. M49637_WE12]|nr:hypothetical protein [Microcystis sp. M49637_WE12]